MKLRYPCAPKLKITVTEEIIAKSMLKDSRHCMIAETIKILRPDAQSISVDLATIRFTDPAKHLRYTYLTPRIAQSALVNFDQGKPPAPFSFLLRGAHVTRSGARTQPLYRNPKKKTKRQMEAIQKAQMQLGRGRVVKRDEGEVPDRVGGKTPPLQRSQDDVPFSRRRAFGIRGLTL